MDYAAPSLKRGGAFLFFSYRFRRYKSDWSLRGTFLYIFASKEISVYFTVLQSRNNPL